LLDDGTSLQILEQSHKAGIVAAIDTVVILDPLCAADEVDIRQRTPISQQRFRVADESFQVGMSPGTFAAPWS